MRGRKPKPSAVKALEGNPGHRPVNSDEPLPPKTEAVLVPPPELEGNVMAIRYWSELVPLLRQIRQITDVDRGVLVALCVQWSRYIEATRALESRDELGRSRMLVKLDNGSFVQNPYIGIANRALQSCLKLWPELGLTPSSRSRIRIDTSLPRADDPFAEFDQPMAH